MLSAFKHQQDKEAVNTAWQHTVHTAASTANVLHHSPPSQQAWRLCHPASLAFTATQSSILLSKNPEGSGML